MNHRLVYIAACLLFCSLISGCYNKDIPVTNTASSETKQVEILPPETTVITEDITNPTHETIETTAEIDTIEETEATAATFPTSSNAESSQTNNVAPKETQPPATQSPATQPPALPLEDIGEVEEGTGWG